MPKSKPDPSCYSVDYWMNLLNCEALKEKSKIAFDVLELNVKYVKTCENARKKYDKKLKILLKQFLKTPPKK